MNLVQADAFHRCQIHVVVNRTFPGFKRGNVIHLFFRKHKVKDVEVLNHPFFVYRLGNDHHIALVQPAENDLSHRTPVLFGDGFQHGIVPDVIQPLGKRRPCLMLDSLLLQEGIGGLLLEERMRFKLVHSRFHFIVQEKVLQTFIGKARHADGADKSFFVKPLAGSSCRIIVAVGFVQQIEVDIIKSKQFQ